ncbi:ATP-binding protein [Intrasporangium sp. YIM S08009]|uniref:sensor histidine kinase n=1 Tax=Intrasporangium zincisolvens TaxID=3080018 RepID=UPI002B057D01|nr:ATP-binding protein [Intrasporangium sp. YIM S08009]
MAAYIVRGIVQRQFEIRALTIARAVALDGRYATWLESTTPSPTGPVQREAESVRVGTNAQSVILIDGQGIRYSHPDARLVGGKVRADLRAVLAGAETMAVEDEADGSAARGRVPLHDDAGRVVGVVSVGLGMSRVNDSVWAITRGLVLAGGAVLVLGIAGAYLLARRLRRSTHGLEPAEMADLLRGQQALLSGVRDGVMALDADGTVTATNDEAHRILGVVPVNGVKATDAGLPAEVLELVSRADGPRGELVAVGDNTVTATRLPVMRDGRDLGSVLVLRDQSDLDDLSRELEATRALTDALRAQAHEYTNRIHTVAGMLHLGHVAQARDYLLQLHSATTWGELITDPYLAGLLTAKAAIASEAGVLLRVGDTTWVEGRLHHPLDCVTVVANLVDNAIRAVDEPEPSEGSDPDRRWVEVTLVSDGAALVVHVVDSGPGIAPRDSKTIFQPGFTTRALTVQDRRRHGLGLSLAQRTARRHGGDVELVDPGSHGHGAAFTARLEDVIEGPGGAS